MADKDYVPPAWVVKGRRVRCMTDHSMKQNVQGREGTISRVITSVFTDWCYVTFPKQGRELKDRERMMEIKHLEDLDD